MTPRRIAIIGSGPIGLEAAIYARSLGHDVVVFEKGGDLAGNVRSWGFVRLFSPWRMNVTPLGLAAIGERPKGQKNGEWFSAMADVCPSGNELIDRYLAPMAESDLLRGCVRRRTAVLSVGRDSFSKADQIGKPARATSPFRILTVDVSGHEAFEHADVVLDCSGTYGNHRWAGRGGIPALGERAAEKTIFYTLPDVQGQDQRRFANKHTLLLGAGYSAATVLTGLEHVQRQHPQTRVSWAIRRPGQALQAVVNDPLADRRMLVEASMRLAASPPPWLQFLGNCVMERVAGGPPFDVTLWSNGTDLVLHVDQIVALVGYVPDDSIYEQLQVHQCYATGGTMRLSAALLGEAAADCLAAGSSVGPDTLVNPEPNFFILGAKSFGTNSNFLLQVGHRQIRDAFQILEGVPTLDLYKQGSS